MLGGDGGIELLFLRCWRRCRRRWFLGDCTGGLAGGGLDGGDDGGLDGGGLDGGVGGGSGGLLLLDEGCWRGRGISIPGSRSLLMYHSHSFSSCAMSNHKPSLPSLLSTCLAVISPVSLFLNCLYSFISSGNRTCKLFTSDFLFVVSTPPGSLGLLHQATSNSFAG